MWNKLISFLISFCLLASITPVAFAQSNSNYPQYIIQPGDSLGTIADRFGVSPDEIIQLNNLQNPDLISPGQVLLIPGLEGVTGTLTTITVQLGENLDSFARSYSTDPGQIIKINRITSPSQVYAGSQLLVPVKEQNQEKSPFALTKVHNSLLETAIQANVNPWDLILSDPSPIKTISFPGQAYYKVLQNGETAINTIEPSLSKLTISPLPLVQGETVEVNIQSLNPVTLEGELAGNQLAFFSSGNNDYVALQGIYAMADPGIYSFKLNGTLADGSTFSFEQPVLLVSGNYPNDPPLTVDPSTIDQTVTKPEETLVESLTAKATPIKYWDGLFQRPGYYNEFNSYFGVRRSYNGGPYTSFHTGLDFAGGEGLPIVAPADGIVVFAGPLTVRGNATFIDHGWGVYTGYFHQSEIDVKVGDKVKKGQVIGLVGNTGRVDGANEYKGAGAHLHWEVWVNGVQVNPFDWLNNIYP